MNAAKYLSLTEAATRIPGRPHTSAIWRWCRQGVTSRSGERIRLEHVRIGGRIFVTEDALRQFFEAVTASDREYFTADGGPESDSDDRPAA